MPNPNAAFTIKFNILLDDQHDVILIALSELHHMKKSAYLRMLIRNAGDMELAHEPKCADAQKCRCPHAHIYSPSLPTPLGASDGGTTPA